MSLYNIELFNHDFSYISHYQIDSITYEFDYLSLSINKIQLPGAVRAVRGDYIHLEGDSDSFFGIVENVTESDTFFTITYKPFLSLFDTDMYMNRKKLKEISLEQFIKEVIQDHFENSGDELQNLNAVTYELKSETLKAQLDIESNIENLYDLLQVALNRYGVIVETVVNVAEKKITFEIGKMNQQEKTIEADLPNIISKEFTTASDNKTMLNKLYAINENNKKQILTYYLTKSGEVKRNPLHNERLTPVMFDTVFVRADEDVTFEQAAYDRALAELTTGCNNLIRITVLKEDGLVNPAIWKIGSYARILKDGQEYQSVLTGKEYTGQTVTLVFGSIRRELTKKIKKKQQKKLDKKVKDVENRIENMDTYNKAEIDTKVEEAHKNCWDVKSVPVLPVTIAANTIYLIQGEVTVE
ncbi:MAG: hypothetical protein K2O40_02240 [Lachnospiraceae bacterium]|nr:hypothetical protein [Lachnospiraceae bacterium]